MDDVFERECSDEGDPLWNDPPMTSIERITEMIFDDITVRTGYSETHKSSYVVAADLKDAVGFTAGVNKFIESLPPSGAGQGKGEGNSLPLYRGYETVETAGGPQRMAVAYKRGVFHLLMLSRLPKATEYRDRIFDFLEQLDRDGVVIAPNADPTRVDQVVTEWKRIRLRERRDYRAILESYSEAGGEEYGRLQNLAYVRLFGTTARGLLNTQPPINTELYKIGAKKGQRKPAKFAKDVMTKEQLAMLNSACLIASGLLQAVEIDGTATVSEIEDAIEQGCQQVITKMIANMYG